MIMERWGGDGEERAECKHEEEMAMDTDSPSPPGSLAIPDQHLLYFPAREGPALTTHNHTRTSCSDAHAFASAAPTLTTSKVMLMRIIFIR